MVSRTSSVVVAALIAATTASASSNLVTAGYPYARACPAAGERDAVDKWKMDTCNCTSYVGWALAANGYRIDWFVPGAMDARNWPTVASRKRIPVGTRARVGAVAVWPRWGKFGHVAFVTAVHPGGDFDVAEYNLPRGVEFGPDRRSGVSPTGVTFLYVPRR